MQANQDPSSIPLYGNYLSPVIWFPCGKRKIVEARIQEFKAEKIRSIRIGIDCSKDISKRINQWYQWMFATLAVDFILEPCFIFPENPKENPVRKHKLSLAEFIESFIHNYGSYFSSVEIWRNPLDKAKGTQSEQNILAEEIVFAISWTKHLGKEVCLGGLGPSDFDWVTQLISCQIIKMVNTISLVSCDTSHRYCNQAFEKILTSLFNAKGLTTKIRNSEKTGVIDNSSEHKDSTKSADLNTLLKITG